MNYNDDAGFSGDEFDEDCYASDDDDGIGIRNSNNATPEPPLNDCQVLAQDSLNDEMNKISAETSAVLGFPPQVCKILLHKYHWNKEILLEKFYEAEDSQKFFDKQKIQISTKVTDIGQPLNYKSGLCQICFEIKSLTGLSCGHRYSPDCWDSYLMATIQERADPYVPCPDPECKLIADDECAMKLLLTDEHKRQYKRMVVNSFVDSNELLKWCPAAHCNKVIKVNHPEARAVTCDCGFTFCFLCSQEWHEPVNCTMLKFWLKKCSDDSETSNWLNANTKDCPQCHVTIEKDGGCNHMTCRSVTCKFEFCWMCLGPWKPHGSGWYSCNRYEDKEAKEARSAQEVSRAALQRYLHYYNRFVNHQNSLKFENKLQDQIKIKMQQMQAHGFTWVETQFLANAVAVLNKCRRTLMYTYAFAYYLKSNNASNVFEDNQRDLETATEQLSEKLERELDIDTDDLVKIKQEVQDRYRYVDQRREVLLKHCFEGLERGDWVFNLPQQQQQK
uniref:RBR-type E3 ubiquitin transferase n=1 Tax=Panagrolaimus sp. ES5 TaxID=591445 RepID=A0AC34GXJ2_9BILA